MDTAWNLCTPTIKPIVFAKNPNDGHMTPLMLDALNSSPNSIDNENQFMIPQRRASDSYENSYLNGHQYSVQGSTSTPNSVGQSSGTASPDNSTQLTSDSIDSNSINAKWIDRPLNLDNSPRYCYVFQQQNGSTMSDSASIVANSSAHSTITVSATSIIPQSFTPSQPMLTVESPFNTNSLPAPIHSSPIERSSSVPPQQSLISIQLDVDNTENRSKKAKKRKVSDTDPNNSIKKQAPSRETSRTTNRPTISALTRRRLKTAEKSGEPLEKMHLLLTELTVEDLKIICRKYNLAISGTKSDLLKRLQPIEDKIDVEAILLDAMQEEDMRQDAEKLSTKEPDTDLNNAFVCAKSIPTIPTVKIPVTCSGGNQFDVAISNYLLQHRKQINQGNPTILKTSNECGQLDSNCSCLHPNNASFPATKTIYFAPSTTVTNGAGPKTTVIRVPIASFNPTIDSMNTTSAVLSKKLCKVEAPQCNGPATFCYSEMGSGGKFTLETTPLKNVPPPSNLPKFVQISVPSTFCANVKDPQACLRCKEKQPCNESDNEILQSLIKELSLSQISSAIENSTLTARILALHQHTIKAQYSKLYEMGKIIADSQKILQCQQSKIETARKAMAKIKANKPNSIDTISQKLDITQLNEQHNQQANELKTIQQNHQQLKADQEKLTKSVMEVQEEIHIDQAVEDVVRLIKTNRKAALLIVQLVHKFQCDRMRELNKIGVKKPEGKLANCTECNGEKCVCGKSPLKEPQSNSTPAVVTIDESDEESGQHKSEKNEENKLTKSSNKKKSRTTAKRNNKPVSQRSDHTFSEVMEDIFLTVISSDSSTNDSTKENTTNLIDSGIEKSTGKLNKSAKSRPKNVPKIVHPNCASVPFLPIKSPMSTDVIEKHNSVNFMLNIPHTNESNSQVSPETIQPPLKIYNESHALMVETNPASANHQFVHTPEQYQTPALYNYMAPTVVANSFTPHSHYSELRPANANYHQRRAFLQQKRQTLCEQLEQIERQQLHNEMYPSNSIDIDEELANLGDLNVEDLYNYDFDQLEVNTPIEENQTSVHTFSMSQQISPYQNHSHLNFGGYQPVVEQQPLILTQQQTQRTFQHADSDIDDILDLIRNGEKNRQPSATDFEVQATNAIYQDLIVDEMNWNDPMSSSADASENAKLAVNDS